MLPARIWGLVEIPSQPGFFWLFFFCHFGFCSCFPWSFAFAILEPLRASFGGGGILGRILPRILEHVFPFSNFPLMTSLGFVFKSCYPSIRSMFFANSLFEPGNRLPAGDGGNFLHRLISGPVSTASAELSCFLNLKCLPPTSPWLTRLVLKMPSIPLSSIVGAFSRLP